MRGRRAAVRLLLAVLVAAGVAGMHTLGHVAPHGHSAPGVHGAHLDMVAELGDTTMAAGLAALRTPESGLDPMGICVAILTAFAVALLLAVAVAAARRPLGYRHGASAVGMSAGRGPPPISVGLRIADLSVLRT